MYNKDSVERFIHPLLDIATSTAPNVGISKTGQLHYFGEINYEGFELLKKVYYDSKSKIKNKTIIMGSSGGDAFAALRIGDFIKDKKFSIKIPRLCLSVCAQYIFPAAKFKYIGTNGLVGFQALVLSNAELSLEKVFSSAGDKPNKLKIDGNDYIQVDTGYIPAKCLFHPEFATSPEQNEKMIQNTITSCTHLLTRRTNSFYRRLHVDSRLLNIGKIKLKQAKIQSNNEVHWFYYDLESLKALGLKKVIFPFEWTPQNNPEYNKMVEITLSDWT
jgi:hypothetical protein